MRRCVTGLRGGSTCPKVAASIPDVVNGIFHRHTHSVGTMALGLIQYLTEMCIRNISRGVNVSGA